MTAFDEIWHRLGADEGLFARPVGDGLPAVALNMIMSVDGATTLDGRVGALTATTDQTLLRRLRAEADAVLVGARTVRIEGYGPPLGERGAAEPLLCVVSARGSLPEDSPALGESPSPLVFLTSSRDPLPVARRPVSALRATDDPPGGALTLRPLLRRLRAELGVERVVCEGGPTLNATLIGEGLVSEMFVSLSPLVARQKASAGLVRGEGGPVPLRLLGHAAADGFVFLRYGVEGA